MRDDSALDLELLGSLAALGTKKFEEVLLDEIESVKGDLPLQRLCRDGGWPDEDTLEVKVSAVRVMEGRTFVTLTCKIDEVLPTGCADISRTESGFGQIEIIFDPVNERAYVEAEAEF